MAGGIVIAAVAWLFIAILAMAVLTAAKRADAAAQKDLASARAASPPRIAASAGVASRRASRAMLDRLAQDVRRELSADQVLIVVRDERAPQRAVAIAVAGMPATVLDTSLGPRDSLAAAVAFSGHAVIAPDHGPLTLSARVAEGDAAAVPLANPTGAIAIARLGRGQPLTADDLRHLRAVVRRHGLARRDTPPAPPAADATTHPAVADLQRFARHDGPGATDRETPDARAPEERRPHGRWSWSRPG